MNTPRGCGQSDLIKTSDGKIICSQCKTVMPNDYLFKMKRSMNKADFEKLKQQLEKNNNE